MSDRTPKAEHSRAQAPAKDGKGDEAARPSGHASEVIKRRRALLIGINNYPGTGNDLPSCVRDAQVFKQVLEDHYGFDDFTMLFDEDATLEAVRDGITNLFADLTEADRAVLFYSGHGHATFRGNAQEECLVLGDGKYLFDDELVAASAKAPRGIATVVIDACFSGGLEKVFLSGLDTNRPRIKVYAPPGLELGGLLAKSLAPTRAFGTRRQSKVGPFVSSTKAVMAESDDSETNDHSLNGILLSACLEGETAAASTTATEGLSAFTFAVVKSLADGGTRVSSRRLMADVAQILRRYHFRQTPQLKDASGLDLADRSFLLLRPFQSGAPSLPEPRPVVGPANPVSPPRPSPPAPTPDDDGSANALLALILQAVREVRRRNALVSAPKASAPPPVASIAERPLEPDGPPTGSPIAIAASFIPFVSFASSALFPRNAPSV